MYDIARRHNFSTDFYFRPMLIYHQDYKDAATRAYQMNLAGGPYEYIVVPVRAQEEMASQDGN